MSEPAAVPTPLSTARRLLIAAVAIVPLALLAVWWATSAPDARLVPFSRLLYWSMPLVIGFALVAAVMRWRGRTTSFGEQVRQLGPGAVLAILLTALVFWGSSPQMRQQFDETCLVGVSQNMHFQRAALITTAALPFHGEVIPLENLVDKRPPLFSFLVSLAHDLTGYRVANAFAVNELLLAVGMFLVFVFVRSRLGLTAAIVAPLLVLLMPLTGIVATSAGFELLATVTMLATILAALDFVRTPDAPRWAGLLGCGLLFAHSRYESLAAFVLLLLVVLLAVRRRFRPTFGGWMLFAVGIVLVSPLGCLLLHAQNPKFYPEAGGRPLVSLQYLFEHTGALLGAWFDPTLGEIVLWPFAYAAVFSAAFWFGKRRSVVEAIVSTPVCAVTVVALLWFYGDAHEATAQRLFLPLAWATALAPLLLLPRWGWRITLAVLVVALGLSLAGLIGGRLMNGSRFHIAEIVRTVDELADQQPGDVGTTLWVGTTAQSLIVHGRAAMTAAVFERRQRDVQALIKQGDIRTLYIVESPIDAGMAPEHGSPFDVLQLYPGTEVAHSDRHRIKVYRLRL